MCLEFAPGEHFERMKQTFDQYCEKVQLPQALAFHSKLPGDVLNVIRENGCARLIMKGRKCASNLLLASILSVWSKLSINIVKKCSFPQALAFHSKLLGDVLNVIRENGCSRLILIGRKCASNLLLARNWAYEPKFRSILWKSAASPSIGLPQQASRRCSERDPREWLWLFDNRFSKSMSTLWPHSALFLLSHFHVLSSRSRYSI